MLFLAFVGQGKDRKERADIVSPPLGTRTRKSKHVRSCKLSRVNDLGTTWYRGIEVPVRKSTARETTGYMPVIRDSILRMFLSG